MEPKIIVIDEKQYHIGKFTAANGSWLLMRLMRIFKAYLSRELAGVSSTTNDNTPEVKEPEDFSNQLIQTLLMEMDEKEFEVVQRHALNIVSRTDYANNVPFQQPILHRSGVFAFPDLNENVETIMALTSQALFANLSPFFVKDRLGAMMKGELPVSQQLSFPR